MADGEHAFAYDKSLEGRLQFSSAPASNRSSISSDRHEETSECSAHSMDAPNLTAMPVTQPGTRYGSPRPHMPATPLSFEPDASIVLVGIRVTGKSTLAVIAASAMKRRVVDVERSFKDAAGLSTAAYKSKHGATELQRRQSEILHDILTTYSKNCIIVSSWMDRKVQSQLARYSEEHLVIHILRDAEGLQVDLKIWEQDKLNHLLDVSGSIFRSCSNYEFFNVSEVVDGVNNSRYNNHQIPAYDFESLEHRQSFPYLTLKRVERHFLKFMSLVTAKGALPFVESVFPLATIPTEERLFTYALSLPISGILSSKVDIRDIESGADAIELIVDNHLGSPILQSANSRGLKKLSSCEADRISHAFAEVRRKTVTPIIYHAPFSRGSQNRRTLYLDYVFHGLRLAPEYLIVDLWMDDADISHIIQMKGITKVIGARDVYDENAPGWSDPIWLSTYERAKRLGCDLVRCTRPALSLEDNFDIHRFKSAVNGLEDRAIPIIAYNTGRLGKTSACFNKIFTRVLPGALDALETPQYSQSYMPPSLSAREATEALYASFMFDHMRTYVIGASVDYSLSPAMHNAAFKACGIPYHYSPHSTPSLSSIHSLVNDPHFAGSSIGLPFKVEVLALLHTLSPHARAIGAANTIIPVRRLNADGSIPEDALLFSERSRAGPVKALYGDNTDWIGIRACIRMGLSPANAVKPETSGLIIGAGGMARAAVYAMLQLGIKNIAIFNRTTSNAEKLKEHYNRLIGRNDLPLLNQESEAKTTFHIIKSRDDPWISEFRYPTVIISCIPTHSIGTNPDPEFTLPPQWLKSPTGGVVIELGYKTLNTPLLQQFGQLRKKGWVAMDGYDLLPEQGFAQFELFTGRRAPRRIMRTEVIKSWRQEIRKSLDVKFGSLRRNNDEQEP